MTSKTEAIRQALKERNLEYPLSTRESRYLLAEVDRLTAEVSALRGVMAAASLLDVVGDVTDDLAVHDIHEIAASLAVLASSPEGDVE